MILQNPVNNFKGKKLCFCFQCLDLHHLKFGLRLLPLSPLPISSMKASLSLVSLCLVRELLDNYFKCSNIDLLNFQTRISQMLPFELFFAFLNRLFSF